MSSEEREMIMRVAAQSNGTYVDEEMTTTGEETSTVYIPGHLSEQMMEYITLKVKPKLSN